MAYYYTTKTELDAIARAIQSRFSISEPLKFPEGFMCDVEDLYSRYAASFIEGTLDFTPFMSEITEIKYAAFNFNSLITVANFPNCSTIQGGHYQGAFESCPNLVSAIFPSCTSLGAWAFSNCTKLETAYFPVCQQMGSEVFCDCYSLVTISFPVCSGLGEKVFYGCTALPSAYFPECLTLDKSVFGYCDSLSMASFPKCTSIDYDVFYSCSSLREVYLLGTSVPTIHSSTFRNAPISSISIFVRPSLVDAFKADSGFVSLADQICPYTGQIAD